MQVECVPNFSEGRDQATIGKLAAAARSVPGAALLDVHTDPDHNRSVFTIAGDPRAVSEAVFRAARIAVETIDLTKHRGAHPRIGAVDVIPFVPLDGTTLELCISLARDLGGRLAEQLDLPVYHYAHAAQRPERARLPWLRKPGFEGLAAALATEARAPDAGPNQPHPTAGAVAVGARGLMLAFNVDLATDDLKAARQIARAIRESSGGLKGVQAKGLELPHQGRVQVSMNLFLESEEAAPGQVYSRLRQLSVEHGVELAEAELVGLMPAAAVPEGLQQLIGLAGRPLAERTIEACLERELPDPGGSFSRYLRALASDGPYDPGGGSAAAVALALGSACLTKAIALSRGDKGRLSDEQLSALEFGTPESSVEWARKDHHAFANLMAAWHLPKGDERKTAALAVARHAAVDEVGEPFLHQAVLLAEAAATVAQDGNRNLVNDAIAAAELALAAGRVARLNARANQKKKARQDYAELMTRLERAAEEARACGG